MTERRARAQGAAEGRWRVKNSCLGLLLKVLLLAIGGGMVAAVFGWFLGWRTARAFSDGLFWAGGILLLLGFLTLIGGGLMRTQAGLLYSESAGDRLSERTRRWVQGVTEDYGSLLLFLLSGGALMGISALVDLIGGE
jgi:hypothetical protein